jgi:4-hydroxybenzoate polyprenyltransferase
MLRSSNLHLVLASLSLTATGAALSGTTPGAVSLALAAAVLLVGVAYRFNRVTDAAEAGAGPRFGPRHAAELLALTALLVLVLAPLARASWAAAGLITALGLVYSATWVTRGGRRLRPKNVLVLKNVMVAAGWALLPVLGAQRFDVSPPLIAFVGAQVFIGSVVRDVADVKEDLAAGVSTLPVVLGVDRALAWLEHLNLASGLLLVAVGLGGSPLLAAGLAAAVLWRAVTLALTRRHRTPWLLQAGTLATCHCIFLGTVVGTWT